VWLPRDVVAERIEARFDGMLAAGLLAEIERLAARPAGLSRTARQGLGYKELFAHVAGDASLEAARDEVIRRTRQFARRQRMWFRRDPRIVWHGAINPVATLTALLGDWATRCQR
jgi:tRNA dimethylallyltransferase